MRKWSSAPGVESAWPTTNVRRATPKLSDYLKIMRIVVVLQSFFSDTFEFPIIYWDAESFWESFALFQDASNFPVMTFFPAFALADTCFHYTWLTGAFTGFLLTWEGTFWGRRPCLGSKRGRQPGRSPQTVQRSGSCSWNTQRKTFRLWDNETTDPKKLLRTTENSRELK